MKVKIMRGLPGSGKSTLARALLERHGDALGDHSEVSGVIVSADDYFLVLKHPDHNELVYRFDPKKLQQAHDSCKDKFSAALKRGCPLTIVDNTNVVKRDYEWYVMEALKAGAEVEVVTVSEQR